MSVVLMETHSLREHASPLVLNHQGLSRKAPEPSSFDLSSIASFTLAIVSSETDGRLERCASWTFSVIRTWPEMQVEAPSLTAAKPRPQITYITDLLPRLSVADSSSTWGVREAETICTSVLPYSS
ncbi:hypothetical protein Trydic_g13774 [Trypoxylus dichotomus]